MPTLPVDIVNRALDECGIDEIGDLQEGSKEARVAERIYWPTLRQLLSGAHWNFARKQETLVLMADVSGQLSNNTDVPTPWSYMYEWPDTAVHARFVPSGLTPVPFIVASADRPNDIASNWYDVEGHDPEQTKVILTNQPTAEFVFTAMMQYPDAWDALFEQGMVSTLAARFAMPLVPDKKEARIIRADNIAIAKAALDAARVRDGDEGWTVTNSTPDWIRIRSGSFYDYYSGPGILYYPWCGVPFPDGVY